jgi:hypothetical protein
LKALIDRVELRGITDIQATICWKAGIRQEVMIHRQVRKRAAERQWTDIELTNLNSLYPAAPRDTILAAFPGKSWKSILLKAWRLGLTRKRLTDSGASVTGNQAPSDLSMEAETGCLHVTASGSRRVVWEIQNLNPFQQLPSERLKKGYVPTTSHVIEGKIVKGSALTGRRLYLGHLGFGDCLYLVSWNLGFCPV